MHTPHACKNVLPTSTLMLAKGDYAQDSHLHWRLVLVCNDQLQAARAPERGGLSVLPHPLAESSLAVLKTQTRPAPMTAARLGLVPSSGRPELSMLLSPPGPWALSLGGHHSPCEACHRRGGRRPWSSPPQGLTCSSQRPHSDPSCPLGPSQAEPGVPQCWAARGSVRTGRVGSGGVRWPPAQQAAGAVLPSWPSLVHSGKPQSYREPGTAGAGTSSGLGWVTTLCGPEVLLPSQ